MKLWKECSNAEKLERWENVRRVLRKLTKHERKAHWNMGSWGQITACGTIACAAGHCSMDPWFNSQGFATHSSDELEHYLYFKGSTEYYEGNASVVAQFFGGKGAEKIFYNSTQRPVGDVIREVTRYIKELQKETQDDERKNGY